MKAKITTVQDAKDLAHKITGDTPEAQAEKISFFEKIAKQIEDINPSIGGFEELSMLISLSDEHFNILAPVFLEELEKSFNNVDDKIAMAKMLELQGMKSEDLLVLYKDISKQIDDQLKDQLSPNKIDFLKMMMGIIINAVAETELISKRIIQIPCEIINGAKKPNYARLGDAGLDVYALEDYTVNPGETILVKTGVKVALPKGYELQVRPKSGISLKSKLRVANTPGTIDSGYRDEIGIIIDNIESPIKSMETDFNDRGELIVKSIEYGKPYYIEKGQKIAQLVLSEVTTATFYDVEKVEDIEGNRGGGFGSTGLK